MQPTKKELEEEIKNLSAFLNKRIESGKRLSQQATPYLEELKLESIKLIQKSKPILRKQRLKLELMLLKRRRDYLKLLIEKRTQETGE